jgi:hypothetical protein
MDEKIENGDIVTIKWQGGYPVEVTVLNMPRREGDLLQVKYSEDGVVQAFSPSRTDFILEKRVYA